VNGSDNWMKVIRLEDRAVSWERFVFDSSFHSADGHVAGDAQPFLIDIPLYVTRHDGADFTLAEAIAAAGPLPGIYIGCWRSGVSTYDRVSRAPIDRELVALSRDSDPYALHVVGNTLYVGDDGLRRVGTYDASTGAVINADFITGLRGARSFEVDGNTLYVAHGNQVGTYDLTTGAPIRPEFITGVDQASALALAGNTLHVVQRRPNRVSTFDATTGAVLNADFITGLNFPEGIAIAGNSVYVSNWAGGNVGRYDLATGATIDADFIAGLGGPIPMRIVHGVLYVLEYKSRVLGTYDPETGAAIDAEFLTGLGSGCDGLFVIGGALVADAGADISVPERAETVMLDSRDSRSPDGAQLTCEWTQISGIPVTLSDTAAANPTFRAPRVDATGDTLRFVVRVSTGEEVATDTVDVRVEDTAEGGDPLTFQHKKLKARIDFKKPDKDTCTLVGLIELPPEFALDGRAFGVDLAGVEETFTPDAKGRAKTAAGSLKLTYSKKKGLWKFKVNLKKGNFAADWADDGLDDASIARTLFFPITIRVDGETYNRRDIFRYRAKVGKWGKLQ
jgi:hypothetical protein